MYSDEDDGHVYRQVIAAEGEQKASKALKEAADVLQQSPSALQVLVLVLVKIVVLFVCCKIHQMQYFSCATCRP